MVQRKQLEVPAFFEGWDWNRVFNSWRYELMGLDTSLESPLFTELRLFVPGYSWERVELNWCPPEKILPFHALRQSVFDRSGMEELYMGNLSYGEGPKYTLDHLWNIRDDIHKVAAVLISASLFPLIHSSRAYRDRDMWPSYVCLDRLDDWARDAWGISHGSWPNACTDVLPFGRNPREPITTAEQLIRWFATDHALLLTKYFPIALVHGTERDPIVDAFIKEKKEDQLKKHELWQAERKKQEAIELEKNKLLREKHPRYGEWEKVTKEELTQLVWNKPTTSIASDFGVSDVAIGKKCKAMGITKPPRGYWAKNVKGCSSEDAPK